MARAKQNMRKPSAETMEKHREYRRINKARKLARRVKTYTENHVKKLAIKQAERLEYHQIQVKVHVEVQVEKQPEDQKAKPYDLDIAVEVKEGDDVSFRVPELVKPIEVVDEIV